MRQELSRHPLAYAILLFGLSVFVVLFLGAWPNHILQRLIILAMAIFYFLWGVMTHYHTAHITRSIILEYAGMAAVASVLLLLITW